MFMLPEFVTIPRAAHLNSRNAIESSKGSMVSQLIDCTPLEDKDDSVDDGAGVVELGKLPLVEDGSPLVPLPDGALSDNLVLIL